MAEPLDSFIASAKQYLVAVEWLDWAESFVGDYVADVLDGNITGDSSNDCRRSFNMTINNAEGLYIPNESRVNMGIKVRIKRGIATPSGNYWWNRGIFVLSDPECVNKGGEKTVSLQGLDKWALLDGTLGGTLTDTYVIPSGTNIAEAIRAAVELVGETKFAFDVCTYTTPYTITKEPGDTIADLIKELALIPSWDLFYDLNGYLRFTPLFDPLQKQVMADLSVGGAYRKCYMSGSYTPKWSDIKNKWKVIGYSDSDLGITYSGTAENNNPESPTNTSDPPIGIGEKADVITDTNLTTNSLCEQRAIYELRKNLTKIDRCSVEIEPLAFLNEGDCVQLEDVPAGIVDDKYEVQSFTEPLGPLGLMQLECWRCASIFEIVAYEDFASGMGDWEQLGSGTVDVYGLSGNNCLRKSANADPNGGCRVLDKTCTDFEHVLYTRRDASGSGNNSYSITDSSGNGYGLSLDYAGHTLTIDKRTAWTASVLATVAITPSLSGWYTLRLIKVASNLEAEIYEGKETSLISPLASVGTVDASYTSFTQENVNGGFVFYTDEPTVRKLL